jgi:hypothetical protein
MRRELNELLVEHIDWLRASADRFDGGHVSEFKRIAVAIRTLVHDTPSSNSLLGQLGMRDRMTWLSAVPLGPAGFVSAPWIDDPRSPGFAPIDRPPEFSTDFLTWWKGLLLPVGVSPSDRSWMVLQVANFDGGAHVDPDLPVEYRSISRDGGLEPVRINSAGATYPDASNPIPNGLRTICSEVVISIEAAW